MKKTVTILLTAVFILQSGVLFSTEKKNYKMKEVGPLLSYPVKTKWVTKLKKEKIITKRPYQFASPVIVDGRIYVGTVSGWFYCIDEKSGNKIWKTDLDTAVYADAAVSGDKVIVVDRKGTVYSLAKDTGKIEWQVATGFEVSSRPLINDDIIYVVTVTRQLMALDINGGGKRWQTSKEGILPSMMVKGSSSPVLYQGNIIVGFADGTVVSFTANDGSVRWFRQLSDKSSSFVDVDATPLINDGIVYLPTVDGQTYALRASDGNTIWKIDRGGPNDIAIFGPNIFIAGGGVLSSVDAVTGKVNWEQDFSEAEISAPVIRSDVVGVASTSDKLYLVDTETGQIKHQRYIGKGSFGRPVLDQNILYILSNSSRLFAFQLKD